MFTNRKGCTIYEKTVRNREPTYIRHTTGAIYWEETLKEHSGSDRSPQNEIFISIPENSSDYLPKPDDRVIGEIILNELPPKHSFIIISVSDRRYGSAKVRHIEVRAK